MTVQKKYLIGFPEIDDQLKANEKAIRAKKYFCKATEIVLAILACLMILGAAALIGTSGGPFAHTIAFYSGIGMSGLCIALCLTMVLIAIHSCRFNTKLRQKSLDTLTYRQILNRLMVDENIDARKVFQKWELETFSAFVDEVKRANYKNIKHIWIALTEDSKFSQLPVPSLIYIFSKISDELALESIEKIEDYTAFAEGVAKTEDPFSNNSLVVLKDPRFKDLDPQYQLMLLDKIEGKELNECIEKLDVEKFEGLLNYALTVKNITIELAIALASKTENEQENLSVFFKSMNSEQQAEFIQNFKNKEDLLSKCLFQSGDVKQFIHFPKLISHYIVQNNKWGALKYIWDEMQKAKQDELAITLANEVGQKYNSIEDLQQFWEQKIPREPPDYLLATLAKTPDALIYMMGILSVEDSRMVRAREFIDSSFYTMLSPKMFESVLYQDIAQLFGSKDFLNSPVAHYLKLHAKPSVFKKFVVNNDQLKDDRARDDFIIELLNFMEKHSEQFIAALSKEKRLRLYKQLGEDRENLKELFEKYFS